MTQIIIKEKVRGQLNLNFEVLVKSSCNKLFHLFNGTFSGVFRVNVDLNTKLKDLRKYSCKFIAFSATTIN